MQPDLARVRDLIAAMKREGHDDAAIIAELVRRWPDLESAVAAELVASAPDPEPRRPVKAPAGPDPSSGTGDLDAEIRRRLSGRGRPPSTAKVVGDILAMPNFSHCTPGQLAPMVEAARGEVERAKQGKKIKPSKEDEALEIAQKIDAETGGELACFNPPETPRATPTFSRKQADGSYRDLPPEAVQDLFNKAAGRPLSPSEFSLVSWFLSTAVLENRGSATNQTGLACKNGMITFDPPGFTPGRPEKPCQFTIPREFIEGDLENPAELGIVRDWAPWGQEPLFLLEVIARVLLTQPAGDFLACFGPGGDGKSTFFEFIERLIGPWNVCRPSPYEFSKERRQRGVAELRGKLLCLLDDVGDDILQTMGTFIKEKATAPTLQGAKLYEDPISFPNTATLAILGNKPPRRTDHTRGFFDRYNLTVWANRIRFTPGEVADIEKKWAADAGAMDAIFSFAVHLAWRFCETGRWFHQSDAQEAEALSDTLARSETRFLWERFDRDPEGFLSWTEIEDQWCLWWPDYNNRDRFDRDVFIEAVAATWQGEEVRRQIDRERYRGVVGIRIVQKERNKAKPKKPSIDEAFSKFTEVDKKQSGQKTPYFPPLSFKEKELNKEVNKNTKRRDPGNMGNSGHSEERPQGPKLNEAGYPEDWDKV